MKQFYLIVLSILFFTTTFAAPVIKVVNNGNWNNTSTWNLNRLPQVGDTIVIPFGKTVALTGDQDLNGFVYFMIYGKLAFQNNSTTLKLGSASSIIVYPLGQIVGGGSPSEKLKIGNQTVFDGNDAPINGPQIASASTNGFQAFNSTPLPVKFVGFTVTKKNNDALIQWSTSQEINADMYEVERSFDGSNWNTIAYVSAVGNSANLNNYSFTDKNLAAKTVYYRIKEVDFDGSKSYTAIRSIKTDAVVSSDIKIASIENKVLLQFPKEMKGSLVIRFVNLNGQVADQQIINNPVGQVVLNAKLTGHYIISVSNGQDINTAKQVIL